MFGTNVGTLPPACDAATVGRHDVTNASPSWTWSAGAAVSTLKDLTVWARALATGALLSPDTQAERLKGVVTGPPPAPTYGLHITNFFGFIGHDENLPGFSSFMAYDPTREIIDCRAGKCLLRCPL
jgi:D-alanyl-D-alanine carboxypeptidase